MSDVVFFLTLTMRLFTGEKTIYPLLEKEETFTVPKFHRCPWFRCMGATLGCFTCLCFAGTLTVVCNYGPKEGGLLKSPCAWVFGTALLTVSPNTSEEQCKHASVGKMFGKIMFFWDNSLFLNEYCQSYVQILSS